MLVLKPGVDTLNIYSEYRIWRFVDIIWYSVILHNGRFFLQALFVMQKSLIGHAKTSVTALLLKIIKFRAAGKLRSTKLMWKIRDKMPTRYWYALFWHNGMISVHTLLNARKLPGDYAKNSLTLPLLK